MIFSIFTPTHKPDYLLDVFDSLKSQTHQDWEWILVPNNGCYIPDKIASDKRVKVLPAHDMLASLGIGALKRFACESASGEWFVELDHDDLLHETCLESIKEAADNGAEFVYSNATNFYPDGTCQIFGDAYGWKQHEIEWKGKKYTVNDHFEATANSLSSIHFAPNHVRAWSKKAYWKAGGHDPKLFVCDDYDLVVRTYLAGVKFHFIPDCLYFYRMQEGGTNTYLERNAEIQRKNNELSAKYQHQLIDEWCKREGLLKLDLGGGHNSPAGYKSVDLANADYICDISKGLPFEDNSVGCIRAVDFLEHIPHCATSSCTHESCVVDVMNEIYRVLAHEGWLITETPSTDGRGAWQDPTHVSGWNPNSFWYYTREQQQRYVPGIKCRFRTYKNMQDYPTAWHKEHNIPYVYADLVAHKGHKMAGFMEI